jgi:hypothetical protein
MERRSHGPTFAKFSTACLVIPLLLAAMLSAGCVRRRMMVRSNPSGAMVYLDNEEVGKTPISTNFQHYGTREFRLVKEGYETKVVNVPVSRPWYQWPGIDFISEVLIPGEITDRHEYTFDMKPQRIMPRDELMARAESLRRQSHTDGIPRLSNGGGTSVGAPSPPPSAGTGPATPWQPGDGPPLSAPGPTPDGSPPAATPYVPPPAAPPGGTAPNGSSGAFPYRPPMSNGR